MKYFSLIKNPTADSLPETEQLWLDELSGPTLITIEGKDTSKTRILSTLLHGNEPSGLYAIFRYIKEGRQPETNAVIFLTNVNAAKMSPVFTHRIASLQGDLNRFFNSHEKRIETKITKEILAIIKKHKPEAVVDLHNTSGTSPSFAVSVDSSPQHLSICGLFCNHLIETDLTMGSLMEVESPWPIITIEAGGRLDSSAHEIAYKGIVRLFENYDIFQPASSIDVLRHPHRFELKESATLRFAPDDGQFADIIISTDLERHNFGSTEKDTFLGWYRGDWQSLFNLGTQSDNIDIEHYFDFSGGKITTRKKLRLFMCTTFPEIAKSDCLFYFIDGDEAGEMLQ